MKSFLYRLEEKYNKDFEIVGTSSELKRTIYVILEITKVPTILIYSKATSLCDVNRNVPGDILLRLKANNGL